jgi:hypothetical protein
MELALHKIRLNDNARKQTSNVFFRIASCILLTRGGLLGLLVGLLGLLALLVLVTLLGLDNL